MLTLIAMLIFAHYLMDYPLQGEFLSRAKNRNNPVDHVPWYQAMTAHAFMHAGAVWLILGIWWLAVLEFIAHFVIDDLKCRGELTFNQDQICHIVCKVVWAGVAVYLIG